MRTEIPKDCAVCDFCNISITDENFIAIRQAWWYENHLICDDCNRNYDGRGNEKVMDIMERDDLSHTELARPIVIETFEGNDSGVSYIK